MCWRRDARTPVSPIMVRAAKLCAMGLLAFFLFQAIALTWCFDRVIGLPAYSANTSCSVVSAAVNVLADTAPSRLTKRTLSTVRS